MSKLLEEIKEELASLKEDRKNVEELGKEADKLAKSRNETVDAGVSVAQVLKSKNNSDAVVEMQRLHKDMYFQGLVQKSASGNTGRYILTEDIAKSTPAYNDYMRVAKAVVSASNDYVPTGMTSASMIEAIWEKTPVISSLRRVDMPHSPYINPVGADLDGDAYYTVENDSDAGAMVSVRNAGDASVTFTAKAIKVRVPVSKEAIRDSIIDLGSQVEYQIFKNIARKEESGALNGDVTSTHMDTSKSFGATSPEKMFRGLRKHALANSLTYDRQETTDGVAGVEIGDLFGVLEKLGNYAEDVIFITNVRGIGQLSRAGAGMLQLSSLGQDASVLSGFAGSLMGIPLLKSQQLYNVDTAGVSAGGSNVYAPLLAVNKEAWGVGFRQDFEVEVEYSAVRQQYDFVGSVSLDIQSLFGATATSCAVMLKL